MLIFIKPQMREIEGCKREVITDLASPVVIFGCAWGSPGPCTLLEVLGDVCILVGSRRRKKLALCYPRLV